MMRALRTLLAIMIVAACAAPAWAQPPAAEAEREITLFAGDVYKFRDGKQVTLFQVTRDGIILADPLSLAGARWLYEELKTRFPQSSVKYILQTHHHPERVSGGAVFSQQGQVVAQEEFANAVRQSREGGRSELHRYVQNPRVTFKDRRTIELGGSRVEMIHAGPFHTPELSVILFPSARIVLAADPPPFQVVPFTFGSQSPADLIAWLQAFAHLDYDTIMLGDGTMVAREAVVSLIDYLSAMRNGVLRAYDRGQSLESIQQSLTLDAFKQSPHYAARRAQIASIFSRVSYGRVDVALLGAAHYVPQNAPGYCDAFDTCEAGGAIPAGGAAFRVMPGRRFGFQAEVQAGDQFWGSGTRALYDEEVAFRPVRGAFLLRANLAPSGAVTILAGLSSTVGDVRGMDRVQGRLLPAGGRHPIHSRARRTGFTGGLELSQRMGAFRFVVPIRVTMLKGDLPAHWPNRVDFSAGAGIAVPIFQRLH